MPTTAEKLALAQDLKTQATAVVSGLDTLIAAIQDEAGQQPDTTPPTIPGSIIVNALAPTGYTLTWSPGSDNVGIDAYEFSLDGGATWTGAGAALTVDISGRTPSTTDQVQVRAKDAAGNISAPTLLVAVNLPPVPDTTPPVMQGPIIVTGLTPQGYSLAWPVATDNVAVLRYEISLDDGATWADIGLVQGYSAVDRTPGATDHLRLRALDQAGNISIPLTLDVVLPNLPPPAADAIVFSQIAVGTVHPLGGSNRRCVVSLHGGGESDLKGMQGDVYKGVRSGKFLPQYTGHPDFFFEARNDSTGLGIALLPQDYNLAQNGVNVRSFWMGHVNGPGTALDLFSARSVAELIRQASILFPQIDWRKISLGGNSAGSWGALRVLQWVSNLLAYALLDMPVPRRFDSTRDIYEVCTLVGSPVNQERPYNGSQMLSALDGGGPADAYMDMIAYVGNAANALCPLHWNITTGDGYGAWPDHALLVEAARDTNRWIRFAWGPGTHGTRPPYPTDLTAGQDLDQFLLGRGLPLFTDCSRDADPATASSGGINLGMCFRNVAETATSFTCQVRNVLPGSTTVTVRPCMSTVFNPGGQTVQPQTVTLAQNVWQTLSWSV